MKKTVRLQDLQLRLSEHLREVREGQELTVLDQDKPIAEIVPYSHDEALHVRRPRPDAPKLQDVSLPEPLRIGFDIVDLLLEERQGGR
jgi:antitoxin (DNA-binding transcriptional repressor) of toxin-antitoxin stability system